MTTRKPASVSVPDWVERQIKDAELDGAFDNLPGKGKPIPGLDRTPHELAWVANYLRRENVDVAGLLPPGLALAKEVEGLRERAARERSEPRVRAVVDHLNARIRNALLGPQVGPPLRVRAVDVEQVVAQWRDDRAAIAAVRAAARAEAAATATSTSSARRRWWRR